MINIELGQMIFVNTKLHFRLSIANPFLYLMPSVVLQFGVFNFQSNIEEWLDVPIVDDMEKDGDGSEDPENHSDDYKWICPEVEAIVTLWWWVQDIADGDFCVVDELLSTKENKVVVIELNW